MKYILLLLLLFSFYTNAQLTNAEVYNYEIGDVHQTKLYGNSGPPIEYHLDTIIDKTLGADSITYTINRKTILNGPPPYPTVSYSTETIIITNLAALPIHYNYGSCLTPIDSSFNGNCGESINSRQSAFDSTCFEPPLWHSTFHEGLGGPYYDVYDFSNSVDYQFELIYSNTTQWGECGNYVDFFAGINELTVSSPKLVEIIDILGRNSENKQNTLLIYIYSDGSTKKIYRVK